MGRGCCAFSRVLGMTITAVVLSTLVVLDVRFHIHEQALDGVVDSIVFFRTRTAPAVATYSASYVASSLMCMPSTPFEIMSGFNFGLPLGIVVDLCGRMLSAIVSFGVGRLLVRGRLDCCIKSNPVLAGVGTAVEEHGFRFLILFNLAYIPVAVKNYGLGMVPQVTLGKLLAAVLIIEVPIASMWALIGDRAAHDFEVNGISFTNATEVRHILAGGSVGSPVRWGILGVGVLAVLLVLRAIHARVAVEMRKCDGPEAALNGATAALV